MQKVTKNIITRQSIINELTTRNKADVGMLLMSFLVTLFVCAGISAFLIFSMLNDGVDVWIFSPVLLLLGAMPVMCLVFLIKELSKRSLLTKGEYEIKKTVVGDKSDRYLGRSHNHYLHFDGFKKFQVSGNVYQKATHYDEFYLVHYKNKKVIELVYDTKTYEYRES